MNKKCIFLCAIIALTVLSNAAFGQKLAIKTNLLVDATASPSLALEAPLSQKYSVEVFGSLNAWTLGENTRLKHWVAMPEFRWWLCDVFGGHFVGVHAEGGQYNLGGFRVPFKTDKEPYSGFADYRYQGWFAGAGITYGYAFMLSRHWNIEAVLGVGYIYTSYSKFRCTTCGKKVAEGVPYNYVGPDKAAINLVYIF